MQQKVLNGTLNKKRKVFTQKFGQWISNELKLNRISSIHVLHDRIEIDDDQLHYSQSDKNILNILCL